jgi:F0F1-type ATP synthase assembly protein I
MSKTDENETWVKSLGIFAVILGDLIGCTGAGVGIGYWAWKKWSAPWWVLLLTTMAGLTLAMWRLYRITQNEN